MSGMPGYPGEAWHEADVRVPITASPHNFLNRYELTDEERAKLEERKRRGFGFESPREDEAE